MKQIKVKTNKHLIVFEINSEIPLKLAEKLSERLQNEIPEFKTLLTQTELTVITLDDETPSLT